MIPTVQLYISSTIMLAIVHARRPPKLLLPHVSKILGSAPATEHESFDRNHVVLMRRSIPRRGWVSRGVYYTQFRNEVRQDMGLVE